MARTRCDGCYEKEAATSTKRKKVWGLWTCGRCGAGKPHDQFTNPKGRVDGKRKRCDDCYELGQAEERAVMRSSSQKMQRIK